MTLIELDDWNEFGERLCVELQRIGHTGKVSIRNFDLVTFTLDDDMNIIGDAVDRLDIVLRTGTDRDAGSVFWNAHGFDHDHENDPRGKIGSDIIYAFTATVGPTGYIIHLDGNDKMMDVTQSHTEQNGILIYDTDKLKQVSKNEYWFVGNPLDALLLVFVLTPEEGQRDEPE